MSHFRNVFMCYCNHSQFDFHFHGVHVLLSTSILLLLTCSVCKLMMGLLLLPVCGYHMLYLYRAEQGISVTLSKHLNSGWLADFVPDFSKLFIVGCLYIVQVCNRMISVVVKCKYSSYDSRNRQCRRFPDEHCSGNHQWPIT